MRGWSAIPLCAMACAVPDSAFGPGLDQQLRVAGAQLRRGALPRDGGGPSVTQLVRPQPEVFRGDATVELSGRLGPGGVVLNLQAEGDDKHWQLRADGFDFVVPDELLWGAQLAFSHSITVDTLPVRLQAVDERGIAGPVERTSFVVSEDIPASELLVSVAWDSAVDLDLHVETPDGTVVGAKNTSSFDPAPGEVPPADAWMDAGYIEYDSNQQCRLDLRNREDVVWLSPPPAGTYRVYVNLYSACTRASVNFSVQVQRRQDVTDEATSTLYAFDAREHPERDAAPGLLMLEFEVE